MAKQSKSELLAEYNNMFNAGLITAEARDQLVEKLGTVKVKVSRPPVDTSVYGEAIKGANPARAATFIKGLEYVDMAESERPQFCQFQVYYRGKGDDLPRLVIDFYTTQSLVGVIKLIDGDYVLMRHDVSFKGLSRDNVSEKLYQLCLHQRNYDSQQKGEVISGKAEPLIGDNPDNIKLNVKSEPSEVTESETPKPKSKGKK